MTDSHPSILICQMQGGKAGINIDSIYKIIPDLNKPKTRSAIYIEGTDDELLVDGASDVLIAQWSEQLMVRDALEAGYLGADDDDTSGA